MTQKNPVKDDSASEDIKSAIKHVILSAKTNKEVYGMLKANIGCRTSFEHNIDFNDISQSSLKILRFTEQLIRSHQNTTKTKREVPPIRIQKVAEEFDLSRIEHHSEFEHHPEFNRHNLICSKSQDSLELRKDIDRITFRNKSVNKDKPKSARRWLGGSTSEIVMPPMRKNDGWRPCEMFACGVTADATMNCL